MANIRKIFGHTVIVDHCDQPELYRDPRVLARLDALIKSPVFDGEVPEQRGLARSTVINLAKGSVAGLPELQPLMQWIMNTVWSHRHQLGGANARYMDLGRNWMNEMYKGCEGILHQHYTNVCVFYVQVPEGGADMLFVKDDLTEAAGAREGDLLIHEPLVWHSVSTHTSETPRICLVIEFEFRE